MASELTGKNQGLLLVTPRLQAEQLGGQTKVQHMRLQHKGTGARVALLLFDLQSRLLFLIPEIGVEVVWWQFC